MKKKQNNYFNFKNTLASSGGFEIRLRRDEITPIRA
jgi:hypothetical protein